MGSECTWSIPIAKASNVLQEETCYSAPRHTSSWQPPKAMLSGPTSALAMKPCSSQEVPGVKLSPAETLCLQSRTRDRAVCTVELLVICHRLCQFPALLCSLQGHMIGTMAQSLPGLFHSPSSVLHKHPLVSLQLSCLFPRAC